MLPGIINQVSLDWDRNVNYHIATIKRHNGKLYEWVAPSGPQLGGSKEPGEDTAAYWKSLDTIINPSTGQAEVEDLNELVTTGKYFIHTIQGETLNPPKDVTADWWLEVSTYKTADRVLILQEARMHSTETGSAATGNAQFLSRCCDGGTWGSWSYNYSQFAG